MFRTTLTVLFAAAALSLPAFAQKQDATQSKPLPELKETESTYEEVPVVNGTGAAKPAAEEPVVTVLGRRAAGPIKVVSEPIAYPQYEEPAPIAPVEEPSEQPTMSPTDRMVGGLHLDLGLDEGILHADIFTAEPKFFGGVLLSLSPEVIDAGELGLTLLRDAAVMGLGFGMEGHLALKVPAAKDLAGLEFFGQAVVADGFEIRAGEVVAAVAN